FLPSSLGSAAFSLASSAAPPDLPSFPTRRSSDLVDGFPGLFLVVPVLQHHAVAAGTQFANLTSGHDVAGARVDNLGFQVRLGARSEEHTSELQSRENIVCRLLLEKKHHSNVQCID